MKKSGFILVCKVYKKCLPGFNFETFSKVQELVRGVMQGEGGGGVSGWNAEKVAKKRERLCCKDHGLILSGELMYLGL